MRSVEAEPAWVGGPPHEAPRVVTPPRAVILPAPHRSRRDGRVAEGARLESVYTGNRIVGSNPTPSATAPCHRLSAARRIANAARGTAALRPAPVVLLHNVKQPAPRRLPHSTSRSRGACSAPGLSRRCSLSPPHLCCLGRRFGGGSRPNPCVSCSSDPEMRSRRSAGRRTTLIRRASKTRPHACEACPSRATGTSASRRSTVALPGAPLRLRHFRRSRGKAGSPAIVHGRLRTPGSTAVTCPTPHPAPPAGSSPETPLMSKDDKPYIIYSLRSQ